MLNRWGPVASWPGTEERFVFDGFARNCSTRVLGMNEQRRRFKWEMLCALVSLVSQKPDMLQPLQAFKMLNNVHQVQASAFREECWFTGQTSTAVMSRVSASYQYRCKEGRGSTCLLSSSYLNMHPCFTCCRFSSVCPQGACSLEAACQGQGQQLIFPRDQVLLKTCGELTES